MLAVLEVCFSPQKRFCGFGEVYGGAYPFLRKKGVVFRVLSRVS